MVGALPLSFAYCTNDSLGSFLYEELLRQVALLYCQQEDEAFFFAEVMPVRNIYEDFGWGEIKCVFFSRAAETGARRLRRR